MEIIKSQFAVALTLDIGIVTLDAGEIKQLYYIEDIFSYSMTGKIIFTDTRGIFELGPLTGNEWLYLEYGDTELWFKIYKLNKVDSISTAAGNVNVIEMFFAQEMFFLINFLQFSRSYGEDYISGIVSDIAQRYLNVEEFVEFEDTTNNIENFYIPYWTINTTLQWLMKRGIGVDSGEPGYLFYNNTAGTNFVTLDYLLKHGRTTPHSGPGSVDPVYKFHDEDPFYEDKILEWSISGIDLSSIKQLSGGVKRGYDSMRKKFIQNEFTYKDSVARQTILGRKSLFTDISDEKAGYDLIGETNEDGIDTVYHNQWHKKYAHQQCISLTVKGNETRLCGDRIWVWWPSGQSGERSEVWHKQLDGWYLIKSITHTFSGYANPSYKQKLVCIKNGYENPDDTDLLDSTKNFFM